MEVKVLSDPQALLDYISGWDDLAMAALEPNPFYESWMLIPAIRNLGAGRDFKFVLIFKSSPVPGGAPLLCGVFPLERHRRYLGMPISAYSFWKYSHCFLTVPLIRAEFAREALAAFFQWLSSSEANCHLLEMRDVLGEGVFDQLLADQLNQIGALPFVWEWYTRAFFRPLDTADRYFSVALSGKHRKALRRRAELLAEKGNWKYVQPEPGANIGTWIDSFLRIESSGWKGREGSAMASQEAHRSFFAEVITNAFRRNRLLMPAILLNDKPIAQNCYFLAGRGSFHFKPAFDEEYAQFSPGFQMECETIRYLHDRREIQWMDSCTSSGNEMYNRLFLCRRTIQTLLVPMRRGWGGLVASAMPFLKYLKSTARSTFDRQLPSRTEAATDES
jgi:hypothetical protein